MNEISDHLVISLAATFASMGDVAGSEQRGTWGWPGRSSILGLVGAALGMRRDDAEGHAALDGLSICVAVYDEGLPMRDFHTAQTVPKAVAECPTSRREALMTAGHRVNTVITRRDYRVGVHFGVALWGDGGRPLTEISAALQKPVFTLYFGRKSCPLATSLEPKVVQVTNPIEALAHTPCPPWQDERKPVLFYASEKFDANVQQIETRQDQPIDRTLWHFGERQVFILQGETS